MSIFQINNLTESQRRTVMSYNTAVIEGLTKRENLTLPQEAELLTALITLASLEQLEKENREERYDAGYLCWEGDGIWFPVTHLVVSELYFTGILSEDGTKRSWPRSVYQFREKDLITTQLQPSTTPQIDNDGWIEWKGGICPLSYRDNVQVVFRNGETSTRHAVMYGWDVYGSDYDIIAYRVIENDGRGA